MNDYADTFSKIILVEGIKEVFKGLAQSLIKGVLHQRNVIPIVEAITAIQFAIIKTRNFIGEIGYEKNEDLTKLWHTALEKVIAAKIDENLPEYLYQKARFWGQPQDWLDNPETLKLIPMLNTLDGQCEMLLQTIK